MMVSQNHSRLLMPNDNHAILSLPTHRDLKIDYVISEDFENSVLWIRDAHVYSYHGQASLSFHYATRRSDLLFTARILDRPSIQNHENGVIFMYLVCIPVNIGGITQTLTLNLCETVLLDAPCVLSTKDAALFSPPTHSLQ